MVTNLETVTRHPVRNRKPIHKSQDKSMWEAAAEMERQRLAHDLHDTVIQTLFAANALAQSLAKTRTQTPETLEDSLDELCQLTQRALTETRDLLYELRPAIPADQPIGTSLRNLAVLFTNQTKIPATVIVEKNDLLASDLQDVLYQIVREAFNNIIKHAQASEVYLLLRCQGEKGKIFIQDNGQGFDVNLVSLSSCGLQIMNERANGVGAKVVVASECGKGTQVVVTW